MVLLLLQRLGNELIERQANSTLKSRLANALHSLTSSNHLSSTLDRVNYQRFRKNLNSFLIEVRGFLRTMWYRMQWCRKFCHPILGLVKSGRDWNQRDFPILGFCECLWIFCRTMWMFICAEQHGWNWSICRIYKMRNGRFAFSGLFASLTSSWWLRLAHGSIICCGLAVHPQRRLEIDSLWLFTAFTSGHWLFCSEFIL